MKTRFSKYGSQKVSVAGRSFGSKLEKDLFIELMLEEKGGLLKNLRQQVSVYLTNARIQYIADFSAEVAIGVDAGQVVYYEAKGFETPVWRIKRRLWIHYGPGILLVYKRQGMKGGLTLTETLKPK